jgi:hypothetical protein
MDQDDEQEFWAERAAIIQFDGVISQPDAEYHAAVLLRRYVEKQGVEVKHHWLRSLAGNVAEWSDEQGKPIYQPARYVPRQFRG